MSSASGVNKRSLRYAPTSGLWKGKTCFQKSSFSPPIAPSTDTSTSTIIFLMEPILPLFRQPVIYWWNVLLQTNTHYTRRHNTLFGSHSGGLAGVLRNILGKRVI